MPQILRQSKTLFIFDLTNQSKPHTQGYRCLNKMKTLKVKNFEAKINQIVSGKKQQIINEVTNHLATFETIQFEVFSKEEPYEGETKNKIFFTYCNHYRANLGTWMEVGTLTHPHYSYEDRGYIKGVATDLEGYMKLKKANGLNHNFAVVFGIYYPRFRKSIHSNQYIAECDYIAKHAMSELDQFVTDQKKAMNEQLKKLTGCSLLHYLRNI